YIHKPWLWVPGSLATLGSRNDGGRILRCAAARYSFSPPMLQTAFHSCAVTGCTDRRGYLASAISLSRGSALIAAKVTGFGTGFSALRSPARNTPFSSVGSW